MQSQNSLDKPDSLLNDQGSISNDKIQEEKPIQNKRLNAYEYFMENYKAISIKNDQLTLENRNLILENESSKKQLIDTNCNDLKLQCCQQQKQIEFLSIQTLENQHLWWANSRHIKEICRYIQLLQLELHLKEVSERYKLTIKKDDLLIPDDIENKSYLNDDDKYFVEEECKKQKDHQAFKKGYKRYFNSFENGLR